ncbi:hypothetical protein HG535_0B04660 [Zygotorulaspora mrakii]|uniref:LrgB-like protein n=1 Tax=Zygotorulaspora mrakii TaxID=42260 RepID=A0A7H9AZ55_ZYGMR|nr:uncharacterized protein HG535_0B04660 [Zygotorulaspora mrakii]QLG71424.1 hypothetical protein HG535_0B04660 [Zygotorulaspora mrakii]
MKLKQAKNLPEAVLHRHWLVFKQFLKVNHRDLIRTYLFVPLGVIIIMCLLYGVDRLIRNCIKVTFPASVAVMLINFAFMCCLSALKKPYNNFYISIIDVPLSWALRWMNLFFTPAFVTLPLSPWISYKEALLIVAVFIFGYLIAFVLLAYITILGQKLIGLRGLKSIFIRQEELQNGVTEGSRFTPMPLKHRKNGSVSSSSSKNEENNNIKNASDGSDVSDIHYQYADEYYDHHNNNEQEANNNFNDPLISLASNSGLFLSRLNSRATQGNTSLLACDSHNLDSRAHVADENSGAHQMDSVYMLYQTPSGNSAGQSSDTHSSREGINNRSNILSKIIPAVHRSSVNSTDTSDVPSEALESRAICQRAITKQFSREFDHYFSISMWENHSHHVIFSVGLFATIFTYYFQWYIAPYQLFTAIVMFMIVVDSPFIVNRPRLKKFAHPVICSVALTWIVMLISVMIKHREVSFFISELRQYKTGRTYLFLFDDQRFGHHQWPGAGDIFSSCMDVSIVALSLPMYTYRKDLQKHFFAMVPPILLFTAACLLLYPLICYHIGISPTRAIGLSGRSITLALGTPMIANLGGDQTVMAVATVMSGVVGALTGGPMLDFIRVPEEDYVTRGLTLGCNCGAIATAYLLGVDRRAAAISSLSFVFYGALLVILSAIGPVKSFVHMLVGL